MINVTREELRSDIKEIAEEAVERIVVREKKSLIRTIDEDLFATNRRIDNLDRRFTKKFKKLDQKLDETNALLKAHILDLHAHES